MKKFNNFEEFSKNVSIGDLVKINFNKEVFYDRRKFCIQEIPDNGTFSPRDANHPLNYVVGVYQYISGNTPSKLELAISFSDSRYSHVHILNFKNIVKSYEVYE